MSLAIPASAAAPAPTRLDSPAAVPAIYVLAQAMPVPRPRPKTPDQGIVDTLINGVGALADLVEAPGAAAPAAAGSAAEAPPEAGPAPTARPSLLADIASGAFGLRTAVRMIESGDIAGATRLAVALPNATDGLLVEWLIATTGGPKVTSVRIAEALDRLRDWPGQALMRLRYEQSVIREMPDPEAAVAAFSAAPPTSERGTLLLARAYMATGQTAEAEDLIRSYWREQSFSAETEETILAEFGGLLGPDDHRTRLNRFLFAGRRAEALRVAALLDEATQKLATAFLAVRRSSRTGTAALAAVPEALRSDPVYLFARVLWLRRAGRITEAANILLGAPEDPALLVDGDAWAEERRDLARILLDRGDAEIAYLLIARNPAFTREEKVEVEFQAGWYALRFLDDPAAAARHFTQLKATSATPLTQSRAEYWLARSAEAAGDGAAAIGHYQAAAAYPTTFYGQLASLRVADGRLLLPPAPLPETGARASFEERQLVRAATRLIELGRDQDAALFARYLAGLLTDPAEIALLAETAEARGEHQLGLQIGVLASARGLPVATLAFPTAGVPNIGSAARVEMPAVHAVARQESRFNPAAVSSAGARGLLQLMPATARELARIVGVPYSQARLTSDPAYNARLGAVHLSRLLADFGGNYVLTFAAYNAGAARVRGWIDRYGDPRDPDVDVIDWIERIPFDETRNYVQRTIENLQVYRALAGETELKIEEDLKRGASG